MSNDQIIDTRICRVSWKEFIITQQDADFYKKIAPTFGEYIAEIPFPTLCPEERQRRRFVFRNERKLYRRECDATQRQIISIYRPNNGYTIYDQSVWWSDSRDAMEYWIEFDFTRTFSLQFDELMRVVPRVNLLNDYKNQVNSSYVHLCGPAQNCHLIFEAEQDKDCSYSYIIWWCNDCYDCTQIDDSSSCYQCVYAKNCFGCKYCYKIINCTNMFLCEDCYGSSDCFMSTNLENKKYMILNKQYSKEEYFHMIDQYTHKYTVPQLQEYFGKFNASQWYVRSHEGVWNENVIWSLSKNCKNCIEADYCTNIKDCKYVSILNGWEDCYDYDSWWDKSSLMYEVQNSWRNCQRVLFSEFIWSECSNIYYSDLCPSWNKNLFWCVWLRWKEYCIFNKQYTQEEYETLVPKIIEHMKTTGERGEFFDPSLSPFGYNETVAQEYYPTSKKKALMKWFKRSNYEAPAPKSNNITKWSDLPDSIGEIDDSILQTAIECEVTGKLFRIQSRELAFYRKHGIPVPRKHPDQRHLERLEMRK